MTQTAHTEGAGEAHPDGDMDDAHRLLLEDTLPRSGTALLLGRHEPAVVALVAERATSVFVVDPDATDPSPVRGVSTVPHLTTELREQPVDTLVSLSSGLDELPPLVPGGARPTVDDLTALLQPGGTLLVRVVNPHSLADFETRGGAGPARLGDAFADRATYRSLFDLERALVRSGKGPTAVYGCYGEVQDVVILQESAARAAGSKDLPLDLALRASGADPEFAERLALAGLASAVARSWVGVLGADGSPIYRREPMCGWARGRRATDGAGWEFLPSSTGRHGESVRQEGAGPTVASALRQALSHGDLTTYRALAKAVGRLALEDSERRPLDLTRLRLATTGSVTLVGGDSLLPSGVSTPGQDDPSSAAPAARTPEDVLAHAWLDFTRDGDARASWDHLLDDRARLHQWLVLAGGDPANLAPATAALFDTSRPALREALERREQQLGHREAYIRGLRRQWTDAQLELERLTNHLERLESSAAYRHARTLETALSPRLLARAIARRATRGAGRILRIVAGRR